MVEEPGDKIFLAIQAWPGSHPLNSLIQMSSECRGKIVVVVTGSLFAFKKETYNPVWGEYSTPIASFFWFSSEENFNI